MLTMQVCFSNTFTSLNFDPILSYCNFNGNSSKKRVISFYNRTIPHSVNDISLVLNRYGYMFRTIGIQSGRLYLLY